MQYKEQTQRNTSNADTAVQYYHITKRLATLCPANKKGVTVEVNLVSYSNDTPHIDIRKWGHGGRRTLKGVDLTDAEARTLMEVLQAHFAPTEANN